MGKKMDILKQLSLDIKNGTSYSVKFLLDEDVQETVSEKGINRRKIIASMLRKIYVNQSDYILQIDPESKKPIYSGSKIYVLNHRQADDIVLGVNAVGDSGYIVFGNKFLALETFNGLGLWAYGMILLDRDSDSNRKSTYEKMKYVLNHGGNVIIYPEGYWNLDDDGLADEKHGADDHNSENWLIQDINIGAVRLARELGVPIVPTVLHYDEFGEKICYAKKGDLFFVAEEDDIFNKKDELLEIMRTLYYDLMERYSSYDRASLESCGLTMREQWVALKKQLVSDCNIDRVGYKLDLYNEKLIGKSKVLKPVIPNKIAFDHLEELDYNMNNAFLLSKRYSGRY